MRAYHADYESCARGRRRDEGDVQLLAPLVSSSPPCRGWVYACARKCVGALGLELQLNMDLLLGVCGCLLSVLVDVVGQ